MYNPFSESRVDGFKDTEVVDLFVPNLVWDEVREPINHIIYGAPGTGKSMLLKRLSSESMLYKEDYLKGQKFIGIYLQISKVSNIFHPIFAHLKGGKNKEEEKFWLQKLFAHYLCIKVLDKIVDVLEKICEKEGKGKDGFVKAITIELNEKYISLQDIKDFCRKQEQAIEQSIPYLATSAHEYKPLFEIRSFLDRITSEIIKVYKSVFGEDIHIYLLFDESSATPIECQEVINITLQRGYPYRTKLAVRPYEWEALNALDGPSLEIDSDFKLLQVEYLNKDEDAYRKLLKDMANKMIAVRAINEEKEGWSKDLGIEYLLNDIKGEYSGFDKICKVSSGSILGFLLLCSKMFVVADEEGEFSNGICPILHEIQDKVVKRYSKEQLFYIERIKKGEEIQNLCRALLKKIKEAEGFKGNLIKIESSQAQQSLFEDEFLEKGMGKGLKSAFTYGFFRFLDKNSGNFWRVPSTFSINRVLFPRENIGFEEDQQPLVIDQEFIKKYSKGSPPLSTKPSEELDELEEKELSAFLSTSLSPYSKDQRDAIKKILSIHKIKCSDIEGLSSGTFILPNIIEHIEKHDLTIIDFTEIRPNVMLELGICAELAKPVFCIFNQAKVKMEDLPEWAILFSIIPYEFEPKKLSKMASKIRSEIFPRMWNKDKKKFINKEFIKTKEYKSPLRIPMEKNCIYLSYPPNRDAWKMIYPKIKEHFKKKSYRVIKEDDAWFVDVNCITSPIFCASLAEYIFVDTTDLKNNPLQSYKLGVVKMMLRSHRTMRIEEEKEAYQKGSLWIEPYGTWNDTDDLIVLMENFIDKKK